MNQISPLEFCYRNQWRSWLEKNQAYAKEAWLKIYKKATKETGLKYDEALEEAICYGWIDGKMKSFDHKSFFLRFSPRKKNSLWSKRNKAIAEEMIKTGRMTEKGFEAVNDAKRSGKWDTAYSSKEPVLVPADLEEALKQNAVAWENFGRFSNSVRFQYAYWVINARKNETRLKRIQEVVKKAAKNLKPG